MESAIKEDAATIESRDREGRSPLINSVVEENLSLVKLLIKLGANVDAQDKQGFSSLHFAAQNYSVDIAKELLEQKAFIDIADNFGNTPLWRAAFNSRGRGDMIKLLLSNGANPHLPNKHGSSAISLAMNIGNYDVAQFFEGL